MKYAPKIIVGLLDLRYKLMMPYVYPYRTYVLYVYPEGVIFTLSQDQNIQEIHPSTSYCIRLLYNMRGNAICSHHALTIITQFAYRQYHKYADKV